MKTFLLTTAILLLAFNCYAEEWNGYRVGDIYYNQYTKKPVGIVTGFDILRGEIVGVRYSERLYEERVKKEEVKENKALRLREIEALERIARELELR